MPVLRHAMLLGHGGTGSNHDALVGRFYQGLALALGTAAVIAQLLCLWVQREAKTGLKNSAAVAVPALKVQGAVFCSGAERGDVQGHVAQHPQHWQDIGVVCHCDIWVCIRWWGKAQYDRLLAPQAPYAQLFAHALQRHQI
jgi:hypothetical protein